MVRLVDALPVTATRHLLASPGRGARPARTVDGQVQRAERVYGAR